MSNPPDLSLIQEDIDPIPGFTLNLGKGDIEFSYVEGVVLTPAIANWRTQFIFQKTNGKEEAIQLGENIPLREGHFLSLVWALNKKKNTEQLVGIVNHHTESYHILNSIGYLPRSFKFTKLISLVGAPVFIIFCQQNIFTGLNVSVIDWVLSIILGGLSWLLLVSLFQSKVLMPMTKRKVKKKLVPFLSAIRQSRAD